MLKRFLSFAFTLLLCTVLGVGLVACDPVTTSDSNAAKTVEANTSTVIEKHGIPIITNGTDYRTAKEMYELRDRASFATYSYVLNKTTGGMVCVARSVGYPMPASVQISNPEKFVTWYSGGALVLPQAEPNGLFMPTGLSATYQKVINPNNGEVTMGSFESNVNTYSFEFPNAEVPCSILYGGGKK
jgi:hypothetical protein